MPFVSGVKMILSKKRLILTATASIGALMVSSMPTISVAQNASSSAGETVIVTGSSIKRKALDNALPITIITTEDLKRESISNAEQLTMLLSTNGNGLDNLAANADVVSGAARGNNGMSGANLRGQGTAGTLILLNGRRVAAHGLNGGAVDLNQIPMAAIDRIDILKDGASAIYGTDAVGGVINFITKKNYQGITINAFMDLPQESGGEIYRASITGGYGDLDENNFNIMGTIAYGENRILNANERDFVDTFQTERGLSVDTRGTPFATIFPLNTNSTSAPSGSLFGPSSPTASIIAPFIPGSTTVRMSGGVNPLDLPGNLGCNAVSGMEAYQPALWATPSAEYACAYDTGRAVVLQQPVTNLNFLGRGIYRIGKHEITAEYMRSHVEANKIFSELQLSSNTSTSNYAYPRNSLTAATYDRIYNQLQSAFGTTFFSEAKRGLPMGVRWRCMECGQREIDTETDAERYFIGLDGPMGETGWDYRAGASIATSESQSTLGGGYYYSYDTFDGNGTKIANGIFNVLNSGIVNLFLLPGEKQSQAALDAIASTSARGVVLYGGKFTVSQVDVTASGPLFNWLDGRAMAAVGIDIREEKYQFNGDLRAASARPVVFNAPFDDVNALSGVSRDIHAIFAEILLPFTENFEIDLAVRHDSYDGFGSTTNPKISAKYRPFQQLMFRGSYNTSFRVPSFNQLFNGVTTSPFTATTFSDPSKCPGGLTRVGVAGCESITFNFATGGNTGLLPETAEQMSFGIVIEPTPKFSISLDWWRIERTDTIQIPTLTNMFQNYDSFKDQFIRDSAGNIAFVDQRWTNDGGSLTEGLEISLRGRGDVFHGTWSAGLDGTYLLDRKTKLFSTSPYGLSEVGAWTPYGDLSLEWKHNLFVNYSQGNWSGSVSQIYRAGYVDQVYPGLLSGAFVAPDYKAKTDAYITYNASVTYRGFNNFTITGGIKNLLDTDPPFALAYYSNSGANSDWEPRVADPRGRAFTLSLEYKY